MKNLKTIAIALLLVVSTAVNAQNKKIDVKKSNIEWVGKKVTGQHNGTISFSEGTLVFKGKTLKGGNFTVDMNSINTTDLEAGKGKEKLDGHLKADDFFGVEKYPTATLVFKTISGKGNGLYKITADLKIKDVTEKVSFDLTVKGNTATTSFKVNRTKYGIKYGSGSFFDNLGDKTINDDFDLTVNLQF
jgi:polyisoprenoid-binding protein YceI